VMKAPARGAAAARARNFPYYHPPRGETAPAGTPPPVMIVVRDWYTEKETVFAWHLAAEAAAISTREIVLRAAELERHVLTAFSQYLTAHRKARWLHWGLNDIRYGFPALSQRMVALSLGQVDVPPGREVDLARHFKWELGEQYVPHKRLTSLVKLNEINSHGWLDLAALTAAYREGRFGDMLESLRRKVYCIGRVLELYLTGKLSTGGNARTDCLALRTDVSLARWFHCLRAAVASPKPQAEGRGPLPGWVGEHFRTHQYTLLGILWPRGEVPIPEVHQAIYRCPSGREEALDKVKDRVNAKLAELNQPY